MTVTPRKLQRLGASSIVVTLPHSWVKAHGLKVGDTVYIVDDGESLRILPAVQEERPASYVLNASRLPFPHLLSMALTCLYVNNFNDVLVDLKGVGESAIPALKAEASRLLGVEVMEQRKDAVEVKVVLDDNKMDVKYSIKGLGTAVSNIAQLLARAASGEPVQQYELDVASNDLHKYQHLVMRHLVAASTLGRQDQTPYSTILGTALLGVVGSVLLDAAKFVVSNSVRSEAVASAAKGLADIAPLVGAMVAQPSVKRLHETTFALVELSSKVEAGLASSSSPKEAAVLAKVDDALKTLTIIFVAILCNAIVSEGMVRPAEGQATS